MARLISDIDFDEISLWFYARGQDMPDKSLFPPTGLIIDGIAAGFVYFTDSTIAIIDCYISNPYVDSKTRSDALDIITADLISKAKAAKCKLIKCDSQIEAIKKRAQKHCFRSIGSFESFVMEI